MSPDSQHTVVVATHNAHKLAEIQDILAGSGLRFVSLAQLGQIKAPVEDADSFKGNAVIKAQAAAAATGLPALADDSGLVVDALNGAPGVLSARYAGEAA
ncbi:MAG: non-canonical purine NTP pyrophosphatase, partial [Coriobacteriales bacterium]|nr:non-canonical purine NTP pyrophosphatase [Coriobacteriales bacterium]